MQELITSFYSNQTQFINLIINLINIVFTLYIMGAALSSGINIILEYQQKNFKSVINSIRMIMCLSLFTICNEKILNFNYDIDLKFLFTLYASIVAISIISYFVYQCAKYYLFNKSQKKEDDNAQVFYKYGTCDKSNLYINSEIEKEKMSPELNNLIINFIKLVLILIIFCCYNYFAKLVEIISNKLSNIELTSDCVNTTLIVIIIYFIVAKLPSVIDIFPLNLLYKKEENKSEENSKNANDNEKETSDR